MSSVQALGHMTCTTYTARPEVLAAHLQHQDNRRVLSSKQLPLGLALLCLRTHAPQLACWLSPDVRCLCPCCPPPKCPYP